MALALSDVLHAALLHSSRDPIGIADESLSAPNLVRRFQELTRLVFITGQCNARNIEKQEISRASLRDWCVVKPSLSPNTIWPVPEILSRHQEP